MRNSACDALLVSFKEREPKTYQLRVKDNGVGLSADMDMDKTRSLGLRLVRALTHQLDGKLRIERAGGTEYIIEFSEL